MSANIAVIKIVKKTLDMRSNKGITKPVTKSETTINPQRKNRCGRKRFLKIIISVGLRLSVLSR